MTLPMLLMGMIPAALAVLGGLIVLRRNSPETANQRFLLYWLILGYVLFLLEFILGQFSPTGSPLGLQAAALFMPTSMVVLALIIICFKFLPGISGKTKILAIFLAVGHLALYRGGSYRNGSGRIGSSRRKDKCPDINRLSGLSGMELAHMPTGFFWREKWLKQRL